jgi:hypothetical protein
MQLKLVQAAMHSTVAEQAHKTAACIMSTSKLGKKVLQPCMSTHDSNSNSMSVANTKYML